MTAQQIIILAYLAVSVASLVIHSWAMHRLRVDKAGRGLKRTVACRVGCSVLYVFVGSNALAVHWAVYDVTFAAYAATAVTWWVNSRQDVRRGRPKKPRRRRFITITITRAPATPSAPEAP